jgi:DNA (cytosine-5)-methyltransferase 1
MADGGIITNSAGKLRTIRAADLFCGAGGISTGAMRAAREIGARLELTAVNHWPVAVETHTRNHPEARHLCTDLEHVKPREAVPEGVLDILMAAPACTYHSRARGGRPVNDQQRMDPWHVVRWCTDLRVHRLLVENVPEFVDWGPCSIVTGRPIPSRRGEYFRAWIASLRAIGFRLDYQVLCCADYGDPTTRRRFFLIGRCDRKALRWPEPTHARGGATDLLGTRAPWRSAAEIIDWNERGSSIFVRKRPLKPNTVRRILAGAKRYDWPQVYVDALQALLNGAEPRLDVTADEAAPFLLRLRGTSESHLQASAHGVDGPLGTLTANGTHVGLVMATASCGAARSLDNPIPTVTTGGNGARPHFVTPLLMGVGNSNAAKAVSDPAPTITTGGGSSEKRPGNARPQLIEPIVTPYYGGGSGLTGKAASEPLDSITTKARFGVAQAVIVSTSNSSSPGVPRGADEPLRTITTAKGGDMGLAAPVATGCRIDILYRMLNRRELARAMSFDDEGQVYDFAGTGTEITKQIGNAVPGRTAKALIRALLEQE